MKHALGAFALLLLAACAAPPKSGLAKDDPVPPKSLEEQRAAAWDAFDQEACAAKGGVARQEGLLGLPRCTIPYPDAGKLCSDTEDCAGRCMARDGVTDYDAPSGTAQGECEADDSPFGCYGIIENGTVGPFICVD